MSSLTAEIFHGESFNWSSWEVEPSPDENKLLWFEKLDPSSYKNYTDFYFSKLTYPVVALYLFGVIVSKKYMKGKKPIGIFKFPLAALFGINAIFGFLCMLRTAPRILDAVSKHDKAYHLFCVRDSPLHRECFWYIMYHWSKLWQLLETFFIILLKKKLTYLHVVHHSTMAFMSAAIAPYGEPLMFCIAFLNVFQHALTYPLLIAKMLNIKLWKGSNAFILFLEFIVLATGVVGSVYTQTIMHLGEDCVRHPRSVIIFNIGIWAILTLVGKMLFNELGNGKEKQKTS